VAAFAMQPSARGIRIGQMNSDASGRMMADRHMAF